jgi:Flp pilus assembly protein TadD
MEKLLPQRRTLLIITGLVLALVMIAFGRSLMQGFAPLDDDLLIARNLAIRGMTPANLKTIFTTFDPELYIPFTFISYQMNYMVAGLSPWIYHLTNILLHAANALLVGWLLLLLTKKRTLSLLGALLFAVHPLHTEAVVWLAGRKDLLSTFFFLLSFTFYLRYRSGSRNAPTTYSLSILFFIAALFSKVMAATLPAMLLLADILIEKRQWSAKMFIDKIPYAILSGIFILIGSLGKERILSNHSPWETLLMAAKSTAFYLEKFFVPIRLGVFYPYSGEISLSLPGFFIPVLIVIAMLEMAIVMIRKLPWLSFGIFFFLIGLAPTFINFHKGGEIYFASDRYPYMPSIGLLFMLMMAITTYSRNQKFSLSVGSVLVAVLCTLSFFQTKIWDSAHTLFANTLNLYPESVAARSALASMARQQGKYDEAVMLLNDGLAYGESIELHMGLGTVYAKVGQVSEARAEFTKASVLDPKNPEPLVALGVLDEYEKKPDAATENYRKAVEMDPSYVSARNKLGVMYLEAGKTAEAEEQFRAALKWNPNTEGVLFNLALILDEQKKREEATALLERAYALSPDDMRISLALAKHILEMEPDRARGILEELRKRDRNNEEVQNLLKQLQ